MERIIHPISGENGYFCSEKEKVLIETVFQTCDSQLLLQSSSTDARGGAL